MKGKETSSEASQNKKERLTQVFAPDLPATDPVSKIAAEDFRGHDGKGRRGGAEGWDHREEKSREK